MRGWIALLVAMIILGISLFLIYPDNSMDANIKERDNVVEYQEYGDYTVYIEKNKEKKDLIKIYNSKGKSHEEIEGISGNLFGIGWSYDGKFFIVNEGLDLVKTTYLISAETYEKVASIPTIGNVLWSPDSSKLLIGVKNNKKRAEAGELKGTVDLAIYYVNSKIIEPLLEADEYVDYFPEYWKEDNTIGYRKVMGEVEEELSIKYELTKEELVMESIYSKGNQNKEEIIRLLHQLDFNRLVYVYGEDSVLNLLEWLSNQEIEKEEELIILFNLIDEFNGEEYYKYLESVVNSYVKDKVKFIKALSKVPEKTMDIALGLNHMKVYDRADQSIMADIELILNSEEFTEEERNVGLDFINFYAACST